MTKAQKLRKLLTEKSVLKVMGAHDAMGAKLIESHGFDAVWSSGFEIATAHGVPDANILTMTENLDAAINMNTAVQIPVICDCDTGYGNASNVMHMVRKYESMGLAALVIEDKRFPKVNSFIPGRQELASIEEFCAKIKAARAARFSEDGVMIIARIEALIAGWGIEEAYKRAVAYYEAGADGLVIHSKSKTTDEIFTFSKIWNQKYKNVCPLVSIPTTYYKVTADELAKEGYKIVIYANQGMRASVRAMHEVFEQIQKDNSTQGIEDRISPMAELFRLQGMHNYQENEKKYSGESEKISVVIPAAADHKYQPELLSLLEDKPLCMVPLAGKTLLERQVEIFHTAGAQSISVVVGHQKEKIRAPKDVEMIPNPEFQTYGSAHSVMCGLEKMTGKTLVCYSDILFDSQIPLDLLKSPYPITLVLDRGFKTLPPRKDKQLDFVVSTDDAQRLPSRDMKPGTFKQLLKIGKKINPDEAQYEFIGMFLLSREGLEMLKAAWRVILKENAGKPFLEAESVSKASMTDLFQALITSCGADTVCGLVIEHGWSELYSREDYERLERYFSQKSSDLVLNS